MNGYKFRHILTAWSGRWYTVCNLITWPWPRKLLTLPFAIRLSLCILCFTLAITGYLTLPELNSGMTLVIPMGLASWLFTKSGACSCFFGYIITEIAAILLLKQSVWSPFKLYTLIATILVLFLEGSTLVSLRYLLDAEEIAREKAEQGAVQTRIAFEQQRQLNQLKNQFILNVNHELRTPLTATYGYLELLYYLINEQGQLNKETHISYLKNALDYCEELRRLVNNVLDTIAVGNDEGAITLEPLSLLDAIYGALSQFNSSQQQKQRIHLNIPENLQITANPQCLRHILYNLLSNAFKYSPGDTPIVINATPNSSIPGQACISVRDWGPGIMANELPLLFGQFVRLPCDLAGTVRGTGLGLYISKHLVEAMGGQIWVESSGIPGQGSCFCFTLPCISEQTLIAMHNSFNHNLNTQNI